VNTIPRPTAEKRRSAEPRPLQHLVGGRWRTGEGAELLDINPARLDEVDRAHVKSFFAPLDPSQELGLSRRSG